MKGFREKYAVLDASKLACWDAAKEAVDDGVLGASEKLKLVCDG